MNRIENIGLTRLTERSCKAARFSGRRRRWGMSGDPMEIERDFRRWPDAGVDMGGFQPGPVDG